MDTRSTAATLTSVKPGFRADIAALRALAVTAVVLFHFGISAVPGGFVGVDVFFVISGFLMTSILTGAAARGRIDVVGFYVGRVRRIVPALVIVTLCTLAAGFFLLLPDQYRQLAWDAISSDTFTINVVFARTNDYFAQHADQSWFLHCWSLAVEIQFYLVIPFVVLVAMKVSPRQGVRVGLLIIAALSLVASYVQTGLDATSAFYLPTTRAWEFAAGGLVSTLGPVAAGRRTIAALGLAAILVATFTYDASMAYPGLWPLAPVVGTALIIWARIDSRLISAPPVRFLGDISYSVYLWHWPVLMVCGGLMPGGGAVVLAVEIATALMLSSLTYRYVETPFRTRGRGAAFWPIASLPAGLCGVAVASATVILLGGIPSRIPAGIRRIVNLRPPDREWRSGSCFLRTDQRYADLAPGCLAENDRTKLRLLLWGDSTVADLYPGVLAQPWSKSFYIEQATGASCAHTGSPTNSDVPHCDDIQDNVLQYILRSRPDYVVLSLARNRYIAESGAALDATKRLLLDPTVNLIKKLKSNGISHVIVAGPVPVWPDGMPAMFARQSFETKKLAASLRLDTLEPIRQWDALIHYATVSAGAEYISFIDNLCSSDRCLSLIPGEITPSLLQFDTIHFTIKGSAYVANHLLGPILGEKIRSKNDGDESNFDPTATAGEDRDIIAMPRQILPQHYPLTLGASFKIDLDLTLGGMQVPYATILQNYDTDSNGFSIEYSALDRAEIYVRMEDRTIFHSDFDVKPNQVHRFELASQAGIPMLKLDGVIVAESKDKRMAQSVGDIWVGGSDIFVGRELNAKLNNFRVSGVVERH